MYETGTAVGVRAFHVMPDAPPPENERHAHDYRIDVVVSRGHLDGRGMVVDLDVLDAALGEVARVMDGRDLEAVLGADPGSVTVEALARWVHGRLDEALSGAGGGELGVRVWESATAFGGYRAGLGGFSTSS